MSSTAAPRPRDEPSATTATTSTAAPAGSSSSNPPPSLTSPSYTFSAEAAPFVPSFMRAAPAAGLDSASLPPSQQTTSARGSVPDEEEGGGEVDGGEENFRQHFSKMWMLCLEKMQGQEVGMLMDMMPLDIQDLYFDKLSDEYLHHDHEHKDKGVHAFCAAQKMVKELSPEQLVHIEEFLVETDALNPAAKRKRGSAHVPHRGFGDDGDVCDGDDDEENLFMNEDEGMGLEEEEWLLEQMMTAAGHGDEVAAVKKRK
ncbi:hypothetical protein ABB37_00552 [Leptomonas pyrrhocoris]|uniref:Uncharacterized protein n=1 Tax=Leptomonas pyrrhocoris TaxID=157538 RepID=A0A0N0E0E6_LEPPY|nr:hypothetical protein ABB37_00552 [Leptomonas pyrrhocoris]XP_015664792.1 hypothetical protein ABB37_00552 [Leptomonas pyrrhocoris]XP_015664793.1 hypothetical protein ABB37_00552 [Leptomonas pyrrhocoris]KPA86352.1 hypothetical protein ABB37_00552 [Leptomonas pyrrhocoris]KPA86353.1 hypothetical protein ABB37_00552 [Leptomonas pyrrhocoris]KPA86354.1 hypothetical protein ABB37_00552 [Leptomonas pyrrhocoris]|eukprot:XP_015664791.1 hypothetical protein ABB37_00552 [Leptomonas pyrrhocoris]